MEKQIDVKNTVKIDNINIVYVCVENLAPISIIQQKHQEYIVENVRRINIIE
jgi:hypothetical protein